MDNANVSLAPIVATNKPTTLPTEGGKTSKHTFDVITKNTAMVKNEMYSTLH